MKLKHATTLLLLCLTAGGCKTIQQPFFTGSETTFTSWTGAVFTNGTGGAVDTIDGVEFWRLGAPARPFRVIGLVTQTKPGDPLREALFAGYSQRQLTDTIKQNKGDGVLLLTNNRFGVDPAIDRKALAVFRYEGKR
jgi:hypothetical protein